LLILRGRSVLELHLISKSCSSRPVTNPHENNHINHTSHFSCPELPYLAIWPRRRSYGYSKLFPRPATGHSLPWFTT